MQQDNKRKIKGNKFPSEMRRRKPCLSTVNSQTVRHKILWASEDHLLKFLSNFLKLL